MRIHFQVFSPYLLYLPPPKDISAQIFGIFPAERHERPGIYTLHAALVPLYLSRMRGTSQIPRTTACILTPDLG